MNGLMLLFHNKILLSSFLAWAISQISKTILYAILYHQKKFVGHTPLQVLVGIALGAVISVNVCL